MSKNLHNKPPCGPWLVTAAVLSLGCLPALAQETGEATVLKPTVVTGSYIPTAETVGVAPVDVVGSVTIQRVGSQDVLETLRRTTPIFSGNANYGQAVNNGGAGEAYIAVRNLPTLVLLDGRRVVNSSFSSGSAVDVNTIPIAMIERIEVLKDGASALYGSDAIGGVVNIITKKNWNGAEVGGRYGFATGKGDVTENRAYVVGGTSTDKASFTAGAQYYYMDPLYAKDREVASLGIEELLDAGLFPPSYISPSFPGRVQSGGVSYILAGSPYAVGAPGYNPSITAPPVDIGVAYPTVSAYLAAHPGVYIPIASTPIGQRLEQAFAPLGFTGEEAAWPLMNTVELGVPSIMGQDRRQFFANGAYELFGKRVELFGSFLYADTRSEGRLAPGPMSSLGNANITIGADSPINPFQIALGAGGSASPRVRSRFIDMGPRIFEYNSDTYRFIGGLKGDFDNEWSLTYETAFNYGRSKSLQRMINAPNGSALQLATQANADPDLAALGFSELYDVSGPVPLFNPFALPGGNDPRTIEMLRATGFQSGVSELWGADGRLTGVIAPLELPAGKIGWAVGGGFYRETLGSDVDGLTQLGQLVGLNQSYRMPERYRDAYSAFIETRIPITSPDMDITAAHALELTAAGRWEYFDPGGDSAVPKVGIRWQPIDEQVTIRASYSQSFLAPSVYQLYGAPAISYDYVQAGGIGQVQMNWVSEANLKPADAENWSAGIVVSPKGIPGLTVSADYYHITTENDVYRVGAQAVVNSLNQFGSGSEFASSFLFSDYRTRLTTTAPDQVTVANWGKADRPFRNGAEQKTDGLDLQANYELPLDEAYGKISVYAAANVLFSYEYSDPLIGGPYEYSGQYTDQGPAGGSQGTLPDFVLNTGFSWEFHNFVYTVNARYIPGVDDLGDMHESNNPGPNPYNGYTINGRMWEVPAWFSVDMQLAYEFKNEGRWYNGTRLAIGVNNVTDELAPLIASSSEDNTDKTTYDILGRFVYVEISKKF
jgi:iron complex outermembrane recepter protein